MTNVITMLQELSDIEHKYGHRRNNSAGPNIKRWR